MSERLIQIITDSFTKILIPGLTVTIPLTVIAFTFAMIIAVVLAMVQFANIKILKEFARFYIWIIRGTPLLVQLFMFYYGIPIFLKSWGFELDFALIDAIYYALVIFSLNSSAYLAEIMRSALLAVDKGQKEAAFSVGMTHIQALRRIILPQAFMITLPNLLNFFIMVVKNTSLASIITVPELMGLADIESGRSSKFLEVYLMAALMYWALCVFLEWVFFRIEERLKKFRKDYA